MTLSTASTSTLNNYTREELDSASESLFQVAQVLLNQVIDLLINTIINDEQLSYTSTLIPGSSIGKHLRHIHDHFRLLLDSLPSTSNTSSSTSTLPLKLSYDQRSRNTASEIHHEASLNSFKSLLKRYQIETDLGRNIKGSREILLEAVTPNKVALKTSFARELWFTCLHAIHHFSLLRVIAVGELNVDVPSDFGVAPSTLLFKSSERSPIAAKL